MLIYYILNMINWKAYIGKTVQTLNNRWRAHRWYGYANCEKGQTHLYRAMRKHGVENFICYPLVSTENKEELRQLEILLIHKLGLRHSEIGYNETDGGEGTTGYKPSELTRIKLRQARQGKKHSEQTCRKISEAAFGYTHNKGRKHTLEARQNMSSAQRGRPCSEETRRKIGKSSQGRLCSEETRQKISEGQRGSKESFLW